MDSRTSPKDIIGKIAPKFGVKTVQRDIFLDGFKREQKSLAYVCRQLDKLVNLALEEGIAVGIGHIHSNMIKALELYGEKFKEHNIELVSVSKVVH